VTPQLAARRSLRLHPLVFAIDECQEAFSHPEHGAAFNRMATAIIKRGPGLGLILLLGTQRPDAKSLPTGVTANIAMRFCLKTMDWQSNDMVLGTSACKRGINSTLLAFSDKGVGWAVGFADAPLVVKSYNVDGPAAERIADRARQLRVQAGTLSGYAAGDAEPAVKVSLLADVAAVIAPSEAELWSETICARLAELRPELYDALEPTSLAEQLAKYGASGPAWWFWLALLGALAVAGTGYWWASKVWPYGPCFRCIGHPGRNRGSNARRWGKCRRCGGTGQRVRWGARVFPG